jgi:hypothetical protein
MERRDFLLAVFALTSCAKATKTFENVLPKQVAGGWERSDIVPLVEVPETVSRYGVESAVETTYKGSGIVHVRAFRMRAETSAFELMQRWRQNDGIPAYQGAFFFVAMPQGTDPRSVGTLLRTLQQAAS